MGALAIKHAQSDHGQNNFAAITIDGRIVLFDGNDFTFDGRTLAVVLRSDGSFGLERPVPYCASVRQSGQQPRVSAYGVGDMGNGKFRAIHPCTVLGRVVDGAGRTAPKDRVERLAAQLSLAIDEEFGGDYAVTIESGGKIDYRWGAVAA